MYSRVVPTCNQQRGHVLGTSVASADLWNIMRVHTISEAPLLPFSISCTHHKMGQCSDTDTARLVIGSVLSPTTTSRDRKPHCGCHGGLVQAHVSAKRARGAQRGNTPRLSFTHLDFLCRSMAITPIHKRSKKRYIFSVVLMGSIFKKIQHCDLL